MKKPTVWIVVLAGLLVLSNLGWYVQTRHVFDTNALLREMNASLRVRNKTIIGLGKDAVLRKSLDRALSDMTAIMREYTPYRVLKYTSDPDGDSIIRVEEADTKRQLTITLSRDIPPSSLFLPPKWRK